MVQVIYSVLKAYGLAYASVICPKLLQLLLSLRKTHKNSREILVSVSIPAISSLMNDEEICL